MLVLRIVFAVLMGAVSLRAQVPGTNSDAAPASSGQISAAALACSSDRPGLSSSSRVWILTAVRASGNAAPASVGSFKTSFSIPRRLVQPGSKSPAGLMAGSSLAFFDPVASTQVAPPRPKAVVYSHAYEVRARIHKYASYATLPIFVAEATVGQKLYNNAGSSGSLRSAHSALAAGTAVLFGVNSVTGVWNLLEGRKDHNGRGRRLFHGILMLGADAGFVATGALAPHRAERGTLRSDGNAATHRAVALTSMGVATISYLYMLFAR